MDIKHFFLIGEKEEKRTLRFDFWILFLYDKF